MALIDFIKEVETDYDVRSVYLNDIQLWPILRYHYIFMYMNRLQDHNKNEAKLNISLKDVISYFKHIFYLPSLIKLLYEYEYLIITYDNQLRDVNGVLVNTLTDNIIKNLNAKKVLVYEGHKKYQKKMIRTKINAINLNLIKIISRIIPIRNDFKIVNENILKKINNKYGIYVDYNEICKIYLKYSIFMEFIMSNNIIKGIFIQDSYNLFSSALIYVAHKYNIKTIEMQHGIVNSSHPSYNIFIKMKDYSYPEYFLSFGDNEKKIFNSNDTYISNKNVIPIGNMYIEYMTNKYEPKNNIIKRFNKLRLKYNKIISVSAQVYNEDKLISFILNSSKISKDVLYIYVPRIYNKEKYDVFNNYTNIKIMDDLNVYQIIKESNFHSTVYSTCALEAPALGVPNILINIDGMSRFHYEKILDNKNTKYVDDENEYVKTILNWDIKNIDRNDFFYKKNYFQNVKNALKTIFDEKN